MRGRERRIGVERVIEGRHEEIERGGEGKRGKVCKD